QVIFCTHLDTVPPYYGHRIDGDHIHGRGACDAKGQAAAMAFAGAELLARGDDRVGFLFTVGEEDLSDGAKLANRSLADPWNPCYTIVGEPTGSRFVRGHKGLYHGVLHAHGVAGHSSQSIGPSAVHEILRAGVRALDADWGTHPLFGPATLNLGVVEGGVAPNVVADRASLSFLLRAVETPDRVEARIAACLGPHVEMEAVGNAYGPVEFLVPEGEPSDLVAFGTDAPHLPRWGTPLLFGAGSILDAHTDHEKVSRKELAELVPRHVQTASELLARLGSAPCNT
ncbi:MAG TPA: M20/M25/M40 family metallo-hydrolase, partial [Planctomycetota bacterium]|nr:M20/M25/M40 family metallo-hydrolase [Planctomycetota bacterium]